MSDDRQQEQRVRGHVKWFHPAKGYGFVVADEIDAEILLHINVLRNFGQSSVADGSSIELAVERSDRGWQALEVLSILPGDVSEGAHLEEQHGLTPEQIARLSLQPARTKWFDDAKGFGFANLFGDPEDVFVHIEVLRQAGFTSLEQGEAIALRTVRGERGLTAVEALLWASVPRSLQPE